MKKVLLVVLLFFYISVKAETIEVTYKSCVDGDTAWFTLDNEDIKVRFIGIDAPEIEHEETPAEYYSEEAKNYVCSKLEDAKKIELEFDPNSDKKDKYNRFLAWIFVDDNLLQKDIVKNGYAKVAYLYDNYKYSDAILKNEEIAKKKNLGIWKDYINKDFNYYFSKYKDIIILIGILVIYILFKKKR